MPAIPPDTERALRRHSRAMQTSAVDIDQLSIPLHLFDLAPDEVWRRHGLVPLVRDGARLTCALDDSGRVSAGDDLELRTGLKVTTLCALPERARPVLEECLAARARGEREWRGPRAPKHGPSDIAAAIVPPDDDDTPIDFTSDTAPLSAVVPAGIIESESAFDATDAEGLGPAIEAFAGETATPRSISAVTERPRARVLIVDDEPVLRLIVRQGLGQRGHEILEAGGGHEALTLIREHEPDAVVLDAMLPDLHGFEVVKRLRESRRYHHVPVVMVTGVHKGWRFAADLVGEFAVHAYLEKPFDLRDVVRAVDDALAGRPYVARAGDADFSPEAKRLYGEASVAFRTGDLDTAIAHMASAVAFDPLSPALRHQLGLLYAQRGHDFSAIQELEAAIDLEPDRFHSLRNLAILYQRRGLRRKAGELWERALVSAPDDDTRREIREALLQLL